jgi:hypothetical protein
LKGILRFDNGPLLAGSRLFSPTCLGVECTDRDVDAGYGHETSGYLNSQGWMAIRKHLAGILLW